MGHDLSKMYYIIDEMNYNANIKPNINIKSNIKSNIKKVKFCNKVNVKLIPTYNEYYDAGVHSQIWYSPEDYKYFQTVSRIPEITEISDISEKVFISDNKFYKQNNPEKKFIFDYEQNLSEINKEMF